MSRAELFERAKKVIPGGVNSPVRAFKAVDDIPRFIKKAKGAKIFDNEDKEYVDYVGSWGPMILGHAFEPAIDAVKKTCENGLSFGAATEIEVEMAELICQMAPSVEMVRMTSSGTEAVMSAIRLARGYTKRDKIIKFEGCYHGHSDSMLVKAGSGVMTAGIPDSLGVPKGCAKDTLSAPYNDIDEVKRLFELNNGEIAAVILEMVPANMGVVLPKEGFLKQLKLLCEQNNALLIADEVITGFRLGVGGAQSLYSVKADITTFGKIIGGGMPVGAYGGKREIMEHIAPSGGVYQAGTLSGNPVAMACGMAQLKFLRDNAEVYSHIETLSKMLSDGLLNIAKSNDVSVEINSIGSLSSMFFTEEPVTDYETAKKSDTKKFAKYFKAMLKNGIYLAPSQFEATFVSYAHTEADIEFTLYCADKSFKEMSDKL